MYNSTTRAIESQIWLMDKTYCFLIGTVSIKIALGMFRYCHWSGIKQKKIYKNLNNHIM